MGLPAPAELPPPGPPPAPIEPCASVPLLTQLQDEIRALTRKLTPRYIRFARLLAGGSDQTQAAIDCGYSPTSAAGQGSTMAAKSEVKDLVEKLLELDILTEAFISKPALRKVLIEVMERAPYGERVAAVRAAIRLEGHDKIKVEVTGNTAGLDAETLRKELAERLARQRGEI